MKVRGYHNFIPVIISFNVVTWEGKKYSVLLIIDLVNHGVVLSFPQLVAMFSIPKSSYIVRKQFKYFIHYYRKRNLKCATKLRIHPPSPG